MTYSKYFLPKEKKIPLPITIAIVILIIFFIARFFTESPLPSRADKKSVKALTLANLSHNQTGIFWQTDEPETGWVVYGTSEKNLELTASDERDLQDKKTTYRNHFVLLKNLQPGTIYFYKIVSDNQLVEQSKDVAFTFKTVASPSTSNLNPAYGKVIKENGSALENALVMITIEKAYPLITLSKTTGEWLIPLNPIINRDSLKNQQVSPEENLTVDIFSEDNLRSNIKTNLENISPLPQTVIIGKNFDFLREEEVLSASSNNNSNAGKIDILFPKESAVIPGGKPLIKGMAISGSEVEVAIDAGKRQLFKTVADKDGLWSIVTKTALPPGSHILTLRTRNANNKNVQITRRFSIAKSGEQVLAAATPDATFTPTDIPPSEIPTIELSPTEVASIPATIAISPPVSGVNTLPISIASATLIILGLGIFLAF